MQFHFKWITPYGPMKNGVDPDFTIPLESQVHRHRGLEDIMFEMGLPYIISGASDPYSKCIEYSALFFNKSDKQKEPSKISLLSGEVIDMPKVYEWTGTIMRDFGLGNEYNIHQTSPIPDSILDEIRNGKMFLLCSMLFEAFTDISIFEAIHKFCDNIGVSPDRFVYATGCVNIKELYKSWLPDGKTPIRTLHIPTLTIFHPRYCNLDTNPQFDKIEKKFICLNKRVDGKRMLLQALLFDAGLSDSIWMSCSNTVDRYTMLTNTTFDIETYTYTKDELADIMTDAFEYNGWIRSEIPNSLLEWTKMLPLQVDSYNTHNGVPISDSLTSFYNRSLFNVAIETLVDDAILVTEKSHRPFQSYQLPIFFSAPGTVDAIRKLGFDVFDDIIDHSYDAVTNIKDRATAIVTEVKRLDQTYSIDDCTLLRNQLKVRLEHNHKLCHTWKNIPDNILNIENIIYSTFR